MTTVTDPDKGIVTKVTDPAGQEVNSQYDALRRLTKTSTMLNSQEVKTENTYQAQTGYLASTTHNTDSSGGSVTYNFAYDTLGRQVSVAVGSNVLSTTYYDAILRTVDHVIFGPVSDPVGSVHYTYDSFARVTGIRYDNATSDRFTYGYDAQGRTAYVIDHTRGTTVYTDYDLAGRPCRKTQLAGTAHHYTGQLTYNAYDLPHEFTEYVGAARIRYVTGFGYDVENRVTALTFTSGSVGYTYDALGRISQRTVKPTNIAVPTTYTYVPGGHGTSSTTGLIQTITQGGVTLTYQYDDRGNITSVSDGTKTTSYVYDAIGQLIQVDDEFQTTWGGDGTRWVFTYDLGGNMLTRTAYKLINGQPDAVVWGDTFTYGNDAWRDQLTAVNGVPITYDAIGNLTSDGVRTYVWEHGKQLKKINIGSRPITFEYNEDGLRTKKTVVGLSGTVVTEYTLHGKNITHMTRGDDELHFYYDAQNKPAVVVYNGTAYGYLYNLQGDVVALVDGSGTKVVEYNYDAWGKPVSKTGSLAGTLGTVQPFRYRGYVFDEETGDYYLRSRYYRAEWGRFLSADVQALSSTIDNHDSNLFIYCRNSPVLLLDADGYSWVLGAYAPYYGFYHNEVQKWLVQNNTHLVMEYNTSTGRIDLLNTLTHQIYEVKPFRITSMVEGIEQLKRYSHGNVPVCMGFTMLVLPPDGTLHYEYPNTTVDVIVRQFGPIINYKLKTTRRKRVPSPEYEYAYDYDYEEVDVTSHATAAVKAPAWGTILAVIVLAATIFDGVPGDEIAALGALIAIP